MMCAWVVTRAQEYNIANFSVADGLAQSQVYAMCEDRRGALWFGTRGGGVSRFDGVSFTAFSEDEGLLNNYVRCMVEDRTGKLWFGTDEGVSVYNGRTFANYSRRTGLQDYIINAIAQDSAGTVWIGTEQGSVWNYANGSLAIALGGNELPGSKVYALMVDKRGQLWIGTNSGVVVYADGKNRVYTARDGLATNIVQSIVEGTDGAVWITTYGGGVSRYKNEHFTTYTARDGLNNQTVLCAAIERNGIVWCGTAGGGVGRYDGMQWRMLTEAEGLCNNVVTSVLCASDGTVWCGTSGGGVSRFDGERFVHFTAKSGAVGNWVYALVQDTSGAMWLGSSLGGVTKYDGQLYTRYTARNGFTAAKVKCMLQSSTGTLWFGTVGDGAYLYDFKTFKHLGKSSGLKARFINAMCEDGRGNVWFATSDVGIVWYRPASTQPFVVLGKAEGVGTTRVYDVYAEGDSVLWAATDGAGVCKVSYKGDSLLAVQMLRRKEGLHSTTVRSVVPYKAGHLLFGTAGGGLVLYNGKTMRALGRSDGMSSNNVYSVLYDSTHVWVGTERGIDRITLDSTGVVQAVRHYGKGEGITGVETAQNAVCRDREGNIWFGTVHGAVKYNPREDKANTRAPQIHITEMRLFFDEISTTPFVDSTTAWYRLPVGLHLPYNQNHVSFDVVGVNLRNPEAVQYQWKLAGFDEQWTPKTKQHTAVFSNLPPGQYAFHVRAYNEDGIVSKPAVLRFAILPPWWQAWWFRLLAGVLGSGALGLAFYARLRVVQQRGQRERDALEMRRAIVELEQKALRLSMNPHFIFNVLTAIQSFIGHNDTTAARRYLAKFAKLMRAILENSRVAAVPLQEEIEVLEQYLALEQVRLGNNRLAFSIEYSEELQGEEITIPPMLIQPLVENAVQHGVLHKEGLGHVWLRFAREGEGLLRCTVQDDGVGRQRAAELEQRDGQHVSTGLLVIQERCEVFRQQYGVDARFSLGDVVDANGVLTGTRAELWIPIVAL